MYLRLKTLILLGLLAAIVSACGTSAPQQSSAPTAAPAAEPTAAPAAEPTAAPAAAEPTAAPAENLEPIRIGLSAPMTGPNASIGEGAEMGVRLAIEDLGGNINGRPIELFVVDDKCAPADAVTVVRRLIDEDQVHAIIGPLCSGATLAALPIVEEGQVPQLSVTSSSPAIYDEIGEGRNEWGFRLNLDDLIIAKTFASYMAQESSKIFFVAQNNDFGRGAVEAYEAVLPEFNIEIVGTEYYDEGTTDFRPILTKIKQSGADSIMTIMVEYDSVPFFRQLKETGITDLNIYTRSGVTSPLFLEMTTDDPSLGEGALSASYWTSGLDPDAEQRFAERWGTPATVHRMMSYYGMKLVMADAIKRVLDSGNELTPSAVQEALKATNLAATPIGDISFDEHHQAYPFLTIDTIKDGKISLLATMPGVRR
jgi:branched-chain amino acid transport system substrate-binding protein